MAAPLYSPYVSVQSSIRQELNQLIPTVGDETWYSDTELLDYILARRLQNAASTYQFVQVSGGSAAAGTKPQWGWSGKPSRYTYLHDLDFTGQNDVVYTVNCSGSIIVTSGTHSGSANIAVTGLPVDFSYIMTDILKQLAVHRVEEIAVKMGNGGEINPTTVYDQLIDAAARWQGVRGG